MAKKHIESLQSLPRQVEVVSDQNNFPVLCDLEINDPAIEAFFNEMIGSRAGKICIFFKSSESQQLFEMYQAVKMGRLAWGHVLVKLISSGNIGFGFTENKSGNVHIFVDNIIAMQLLYQAAQSPDNQNRLIKAVMTHLVRGLDSEKDGEGNWISKVLQHELNHAAKTENELRKDYLNSLNRLKLRIAIFLGYTGALVALPLIELMGKRQLPDDLTTASWVGYAVSLLSLAGYVIAISKGESLDYDIDLNEEQARSSSQVDLGLVNLTTESEFWLAEQAAIVFKDVQLMKTKGNPRLLAAANKVLTILTGQKKY